MKPTLIFIVGSVGVVALVLFLFYHVIDQSVTIDYYANEIRHQRRTVDLLASLLVELPDDGGVEGVFRSLQARYPDQIVKLIGDTIEINGIALVYQDTVLVDVNPF